MAVFAERRRTFGAVCLFRARKFGRCGTNQFIGLGVLIFEGIHGRA